MRISTPDRGRLIARLATGSAVLAVSVSGLTGCGLEISDRAEARDEWKKTYDVAPGATFELRNANGKITIDATDGAKIDVTAVRVVRAPSDEAARAALEKFPIESSAAADRVVLDTTPPTVGFTIGLARRAEFTVKVPRHVNVIVRSSNGEVRIAGVAGSVRATSTNGSVTATNLDGSVELETTNGNIEVDLARVAAGGVSCETTNGSATIAIAKDVKARVSVRTTNGSVDTSGLELVERTPSSRGRLEATLGGGGPTIRVETTNGSVHLRGR